MQSLICTTLFYGYGFNLYARLDYAQQLIVVLAVWALQLALSPWWLRHFHFGPAEWLWRWLTYGKRPPMRRRLGFLSDLAGETQAQTTAQPASATPPEPAIRPEQN
jgi:hypothetical protein